MAAHKCYISFKTEDADYKLAVQELPTLDIVDKSLNVAIDSTNEDYILQKIRADYLSDSTVTIHLIGLYGAENRGEWEQRFIKRELQASLYAGAGNSKNGILGVVLPPMDAVVYGGNITCLSCGGTHSLVRIDNASTIREFSYNFWLPNGKCSYTEDEHYCVLASWSDFVIDPNGWIQKAFDKRTAPIASKTRVYPD